jgi:hypothetical protein
LNIDGGQFTLEILPHLEKLPPWTVINCNMEGLDQDALNAMNDRRIAKFKQLTAAEQRSVGLRYLHIHDSLIWKGKPPTAAKLGNSVRDADLSLLSATSDLVELEVHGMGVTTKGLAQLSTQTRLKTLDLWETSVDSLAPMKGCKDLLHLEFSSLDATEAGLAPLEHFTKLETLRLMFDQFGVAGDATLKRLADLKNLRDLDLELGDLEEESSLASLSGLTKLEKLKVSARGMSDEALEHFAGLNELEMLRFHAEKGTGAGLHHLAGLGKLKTLILSGSGVTDEGLAHLAGLKNLTSLMVQDTAVTKKAAEKLATQLPHVTIILDAHVVKSPRKSYRLTRQKHTDSVSLLVPEDWSRSDFQENRFYHATEDGWEGISGWEGIVGWDSQVIGPAELSLHMTKGDETANEAMLNVVNHNYHVNPRTLLRDVLAIPGSEDVASCIFIDDRDKFLICTAKVDGRMLVLACIAPLSRFADFEKLFKIVAKSIRISDDPQQHSPQTLDVPSEMTKQKKDEGH